MNELYTVECRCEHPVILLNPLVNELVAKYRNYTIRGKEYIISKSQKSLLYGFKKSKILPKILNIVHSDICSCYITDYGDGKRYPLYFEVGCGHCEICKESKVNSFVERCRLETQLYNTKPLFLTLTYDELHKKECGVCLRDVQLFIKRVRINLFRKGYREKMRYALVSEYGKPPRVLSNGRKTIGFRPHYHAILWNIGYKDFQSYNEVRAIIEKSWSLGFVMLRPIDPANDKAFYYTSKYMRKDCHVPAGCNKTFMVCSNRGGSIGSAFYAGLREHVRETLNIKLKYVNKWNHRTFDVQINRYALNKLLPSFSRSLPYSIKKRVRRFVLDYRYLYQQGDTNCLSFKDTFERVMSVFPKYMYIEPLPYVHYSLIEKPNNRLLRELLEDEECICRVLQKDIAGCYRDSLLREPFLLKLFAEPIKFDLSALVYKIKRNRQMALERLVI